MVDSERAGPRPLVRGELGHFGAPATGLTIVEAAIATAWNVQGDAARPDLVAEVRRLFDVELPVKPNTTRRSGTLTTLWLGPTSWLLVTGTGSELIDFVAKRDALNRQGGALFDLSASRIAWALAGPHAPTVLAKGCPLDLHPRAFAVGACAQSVYGHVNVLVEKRDETPTFTLMVARSLARDVYRSLATVAFQYGVEVLAARPYG